MVAGRVSGGNAFGNGVVFVERLYHTEQHVVSVSIESVSDTTMIDDNIINITGRNNWSEDITTLSRQNREAQAKGMYTPLWSGCYCPAP